MRKLLIVLALVPSLASAAAATWAAAAYPTVCSMNGTYSASNCRSTAATCAAGTSCDAPTLSTEGSSLDGVATINVYVCADSGKVLTDGNGLSVYLYDASVGVWAITDLTLTVTASSNRCGFARGDSPGVGIPVLGMRGRIAVVPTAMAVDAGALTVHILATGVNGQDL